ncbi:MULTISPECIES: hypothetical protein [unclassified Mesorhizobium]|uniref:hypothetical protein n=1 Tax=unclassified Mesorhizobium TaxID=325217 RepID=UPI000FE63600|nr:MULTISPECIES: hypothetical protein [unclassified Mesorhizobium]RWB93273.1 MAG: hypothetical protein EOQ57_34495 [Mesorhizobium sp.]TGV18022.1 hypothetical protein EN786_35585 [Mesorhizobium sp. M4B.F.Ca.ET.143.01.1.1]
MSDISEWYWRMRMGLPPRSKDREALKRMAPELFGLNSSNELEFDYDFKGRFWDASAFRQEVTNWLQTEEDRPLVTVRDGTCPQQDCPLRLAGRPGQIISGRSDADDGSIVIQLMTVAGGWKAKADAFFDMARKVHRGKGPIKDILVTDPFIFLDKSEESTTGGLDNFRKYLDCLDIPRSEITIHQPPYAKGKKVGSGPIWRRTVADHGNRNGYRVRFSYFRTVTEARFHDRFYLARHTDGSVSGLFGPSMNGLNDKSFVLVGELEAPTLKRLQDCLDGWH